jgi:hypothetical protein
MDNLHFSYIIFLILRYWLKEKDLDDDGSLLVLETEIENLPNLYQEVVDYPSLVYFILHAPGYVLNLKHNLIDSTIKQKFTLI